MDFTLKLTGISEELINEMWETVIDPDFTVKPVRVTEITVCIEDARKIDDAKGLFLMLTRGIAYSLTIQQMRADDN